MQWYSDGPLAAGVEPSDARARVYRALFVVSTKDRLARTIEGLIAVLILLNVASLVMESTEKVPPALAAVLSGVEVMTIVVFSVEYLLRLWSITASSGYQHRFLGRLRYMLTFFALVDLVSILPLYAALIGANLKIVSAVRMLRLFKLARYSSAMQSLVAVFIGKRQEVMAAMMVLSGLLLCASGGIYLAEGDVQPEAFGSIPRSLWWSVVTVTTVGYGDVIPITVAGKVFAGLIALLGILAVALLTGIVSAGFLEEFRQHSQPSNCPHCGKTMLGRSKNE